MLSISISKNKTIYYHLFYRLFGKNTLVQRKSMKRKLVLDVSKTIQLNVEHLNEN